MLTALCVLAAGLATAATPAASQSNSGIRIYDEHPDLHGPSSGWWRVDNPPGEYGLNHHGPYAYTYGNQDAARSNWASWTFTVPDSSTYDVWVWVPANHATAQVNYKLHLSGCIHPLGVYPTLDQQNYTGWAQIGKVALDRISNSPSNNLFLEAIDNEVSDPYESLLYRSIGVSVALLERDFNMGWEHQTNSNQLITDEGCYGPTPTPQPTRQPQGTVPSEPRNLTVTPGDRSLEVSWSPPANDGGSPITGYRATFWDESRGQGGGRTVSGTSATFTGLNNGTTYKVSVAAINQHGEGNRASTTAVPQGSGTVPDPPQNLTVTPGDRSLEVSWSPPANNGGSPITGYRVVWYSWDAGTSDRIGIAGTSHTIRGLTNDAAYQVEVYAANRHGPGSKATGSGIPMGPRGVSLEVGGDARGDGRCSSVHCRWFDIQLTGSGWNNNATYQVQCGHNGVPQINAAAQIWRTETVRFSAGRNSNACFFGYPGQQVYVVINGVRSNTITWPRQNTTGPSRPQNLHLGVSSTDGQRRLVVSWSPPASTGSSSIDHYAITYSRPGRTFGPFRVSSNQGRTHSLRNPRYDTAYTITVTATNQDSRVSDSISRTMTTPPRSATGTGDTQVPDSPQKLVATPHSDRIAVSWSRPTTNGGPPITGYTVTYSRPALRAPFGEQIDAWSRSYPVDSSTSSHQLPTRRESVIYTVEVTAHNTNGSSEKVTAEVLTLGDFLHDGLRDIPDLSDSEKDGVPRLYSPDGKSWSKAHGGGSGGPCRRFLGRSSGCGAEDGFYYVRTSSGSEYDDSRYVIWDEFGSNLRGSYSIEVFIPGSDASVDPSATAKYTIWEKRADRSSWRLIGYFELDQLALSRMRRGKYDTRELYLDGLIEAKRYDTQLLRYVTSSLGEWNLDGQVRIRAEGKNGVLAADSIRLIQRDLLDIDRDVAILRCQADVLNQMKVRAYWQAAFRAIGQITLSVGVSVATGGTGVILASASTAATVTSAANTLHVSAKSILTVITLLRHLLTAAEIYNNTYDTAKTFIDSIRIGQELGKVMHSKIREQLPKDQRETYDRYWGACESPNGVDWYDPEGSIFLPEGFLQAFNRNGYMEYRDYASVQ